MIEAFQHRNVHAWWRRLYSRLRLMFGAAVKSHTVHLVTIGGRRYKRVTFSHASEAVRVEHCLDRVASLPGFPEPVYRHEDKVWVKFVEGETLDPSRPEHVHGVIAFFADLYRHGSYPVELSSTPIHRRLLADLEFLVEVGALSGPRGGALADAAQRLRPDRAWMGFEYIDPLPKNFVLVSRGPVAIDVEALQADRMLGIGLAKAQQRWLRIERAELLEALAGRGAPDLEPQLEYAALSFLAAYAKQMVFRGRRRDIRAGDFERLLDRPEA